MTFAIKQSESGALDGWYTDDDFATHMVTFWDERFPSHKHEVINWGKDSPLMATDGIRRRYAHKILIEAEHAAEVGDDTLGMIKEAIAYIDDAVWHGDRH